MKGSETNGEAAAALALSALVWTLKDPRRADRLLALTGLSPDDLRERAADPTLLAALLQFLEGYEPDLTGCAEALAVPPDALISARQSLEG